FSLYGGKQKLDSRVASAILKSDLEAIVRQSEALRPGYSNYSSARGASAYPWRASVIRPLLLIVIVLMVGTLFAQVAPSTENPPSRRAALPASGSASQSALLQSLKQIHIFLVARTASHGNHATPVQNLTQSGCQVIVDGLPQPVTGLTPSSRLSLTVGLLLDTSLDQQRVLPMEQQAAGTFLRGVLRPGDEAFALSFDVTVDLLADLTANQTVLRKALESAQINSNSGHYANGTLPPLGRPKGALLFDAVYLSSQEMSHQSGRKVLIVLTEGRDDGSSKKLRQALDAAQQANTVVYVLFISDPGIYGILDESGSAAMRKLGDATGGRFFHIGKDGRKLQAAFVEIEKELQAQYEIGFVAPGASSGPGYHDLKIVCRQDGKAFPVQAQRRFYVASP
ncbi:MAG TPA: VWA domain-containing protein, partial [Acidobacteriaceae bacterium]|nr:VWA domain-containing protein [Acidobacteriaceae bacterium]